MPTPKPAEQPAPLNPNVQLPDWWTMNAWASNILSAAAPMAPPPRLLTMNNNFSQSETTVFTGTTTATGPSATCSFSHTTTKQSTPPELPVPPVKGLPKGTRKPRPPGPRKPSPHERLAADRVIATLSQAEGSGSNLGDQATALQEADLPSSEGSGNSATPREASSIADASENA